MTSPLLHLLRQLNSKERFFLVGQALGNASFRLGDDFRDALGASLGFAIPEDAFCAMDYHIDWIYAALVASEHGIETHYSNAARNIRAQQEDVDLLVAFERDNVVHMILVEAKASTSWTNSQANSKTGRLKEIFGEGADKWRGVRPHLVLMSPRPSLGLATNGWPRWAVDHNGRPFWMPLPIPADLKMVSLWNDQDGKPDKKGEHWKIVPRLRTKIPSRPPGD